MDFPVSLDPSDKSPLYRQLAQAMRQAIHSGRLAPGQSLPSTREMGEMLGLSRDTVVKTYEELLSQGYVETIKGAGTFVSRRPELLVPPKSEDEPNQRSAAAYFSEFAGRLMQIPIVGYTSGDLPGLHYGSPPIDLLPVRQWREILMHHCKMQDAERLNYATEVFGDRPLREAIAAFLRRAKGLHCSADQVIVFEGSQQGLSYITRLLVNPGDVITLENPGYVGARENFSAQGALLTFVNVDDNGANVSELKQANARCKMVYVSSLHHDPTGVVMSVDRRNELLEWARAEDVLLVEDAWDSDYRYEGKPLPAIQGLKPNDCVFYIYSFWKVLFPLITIGVLVVPKPFIPVFHLAKLITERQFPLLEHYALTDFINDGHLERHIKRTRIVYGKRRQALMYALAKYMRDRVSIGKQSAGLHTLVRFEADESTVVNAAEQAGLPLVGTAPYYAYGGNRSEFLIPFASMDEPVIEQVISEFAGLLNPQGIPIR
jgi:GntR family transcriptional regulator / MocR family aminotransferase